MIGNHTLKCPNVVCFFDLIGRRTHLDDTASRLHGGSDKQAFCNRLLNDCEDYASLQQTELYASYLPRRHSPAGFQWGYSGSGPAQLAAAILYEITDDTDLSRTYYELFKHDHVSQWEDTFEISEFEVRIWLSLVGVKVEPR